MRAFIFALVLFNIGLAAWYWGFRTPAPPAIAPAYPPGVEVIKLVSEQRPEADNDAPEPVVTPQQPVETPAPLPEVEVSEPDNPPDPEPESAPEPEPLPEPAVLTTAAITTCYQSTPIEKLTLATAISNDLREKGYPAELQTVYAVPPKYLVYLPGHDTIAQARTVTNRLRKSGQRDYQILTINDQKNSISLGVYSREETARVRQQEIRELGYSPIIEPAYGKIAGYRIAFQDDSKKSLTRKQLEDLFSASPNTTISEIKCPG